MFCLPRGLLHEEHWGVPWGHEDSGEGGGGGKWGQGGSWGETAESL